jgi:hypothetical protein
VKLKGVPTNEYNIQCAVHERADSRSISENLLHKVVDITETESTPLLLDETFCCDTCGSLLELTLTNPIMMPMEGNTFSKYVFCYDNN